MRWLPALGWMFTVKLDVEIICVSEGRCVCVCVCAPHGDACFTRSESRSSVTVDNSELNCHRLGTSPTSCFMRRRLHSSTAQQYNDI